MTSCTPFPVRHNTDPVYYVTNVILVPVLFGFGLMGNTMTSWVCSRAALRRESPLYIYLCGLAVVDGLALILTVPGTLQDIEILPANVTYSKVMAYASAGGFIFSHVFRHAALWLMVALGMLQGALTRKSLGRPSRGRWDRNSTARILVFATVLFCSLLNFPRFLETEVYEVQGHCVRGMSLWSWTTRRWDGPWLYQALYPWLAAGLCYLLPAALALLSLLILWQLGGWRQLPRAHVALVNAEKEADRQYGRLKAVWVILVVGVLLELPNIVGVTLPLVLGLTPGEEGAVFHAFTLIANCLSLIHSSVNFILLSFYDSDFRKSLRRTLCCLSADEYYEPMAGCGCFHGGDSAHGDLAKERDSVQYTYRAYGKNASPGRHGHDGRRTRSSEDSWGATSLGEEGVPEVNGGSDASHQSSEGVRSSRSASTHGSQHQGYARPLPVPAARRASEGDLWV